MQVELSPRFCIKYIQLFTINDESNGRLCMLVEFNEFSKVPAYFDDHPAHDVLCITETNKVVNPGFDDFGKAKLLAELAANEDEEEDEFVKKVSLVTSYTQKTCAHVHRRIRRLAQKPTLSHVRTSTQQNQVQPHKHNTTLVLRHCPQ